MKNQTGVSEVLEAQDKDWLPSWCYIDDNRVVPEFVFGNHFESFKEHYENCCMMLELKKGDCPNWIIKYIAAFELTISDQEPPLWIKNMIFQNYQSITDTVYSQQPLSETTVSKQDSSDA